MSVSDLSFDVVAIIEQFRMMDNSPSTADIVRLAVTLFENRAVRDKDDAEIIADYALRELFTDITYSLKKHRIKTANVHRVKYFITKANRVISCKVIMRVTY